MFIHRILHAGLIAFGVLVPASSASAAAQQTHPLTWVKLAPSVSPTPRAAMASAYDPIRRRVVIFGGFDAAGYFNETWTLEGHTWTLETPPIAPPARAAASMAYDAPTQRVILFGGFDGSQYLGDTWIWDGASSTWTPANPTSSPPAVTGPMLFTDPRNGHADVYGGYDGMFYQLTTWQWTGTSWQQLFPVTSPWARAAGIVALDRARNSVVLFGGLASVNPHNTWLWDGLDWHQQSPTTQPPNRYDSAAAFEPTLGNVVLFAGGSGGTDLDDTWQWTGTDWSQLQPVHRPIARESQSVVYDAAHGHVVVFGGADPAGFFDDTWWLAVRP